MQRTIVQKDNPILRTVPRNIPHSQIESKRITKLIEDMKALLANEEFGVALAAPQVGEPLRLFIVSGRALARGTRNAPDESTEELANKDVLPLPDQVYINPVLTKISRAKSEKHEGCLSVRGKWGTVVRAEKATVRAYDENGRLCTRGASGFLAHVFQHEMDHLEGILYTDKATNVYDEEKSKH